MFILLSSVWAVWAVSYTHLDVYKRQDKMLTDINYLKGISGTSMQTEKDNRESSLEVNIMKMCIRDRYYFTYTSFDFWLSAGIWVILPILTSIYPLSLIHIWKQSGDTEHATPQGGKRECRVARQGQCRTPLGGGRSFILLIFPLSRCFSPPSIIKLL